MIYSGELLNFFVLHQTDIHGTRSFNVYGIWIVDLHNVHCPCMYFCTKKIDVSSVVLLLEDLRSTFHGPCFLLGVVLGTVIRFGSRENK